jgi:type I site-specific restriction-modification system R (restriction) subunit
MTLLSSSWRRSTRPVLMSRCSIPCSWIRSLYGVKAVQTLSRLNRTMPGKEDTFVLDFVNTAEDIQESFKPYFEETVLEKATDTNVIYDLKRYTG